MYVSIKFAYPYYNRKLQFMILSNLNINVSLKTLHSLEIYFDLYRKQHVFFFYSATSVLFLRLNELLSKWEHLPQA